MILLSKNVKVVTKSTKARTFKFNVKSHPQSTSLSLIITSCVISKVICIHSQLMGKLRTGYWANKIQECNLQNVSATVACPSCIPFLANLKHIEKLDVVQHTARLFSEDPAWPSFWGGEGVIRCFKGVPFVLLLCSSLLVRTQEWPW